jgi:hypothetical protein
MISRPTLIGALVVVELAIVGAAFHAIGVGSAGPPGPLGRHGFAWHPGAVAEAATAGTLDRTFATGGTPRVVLDVHDVQVRIDAVPGANVRVVEATHRSGWMRGRIMPVQAERTADGVRVTIPSGEDVFMVGSFERELRVSVPPGATVEVAASSRVDAAGLRSRQTVRSTDGSIHVRDHRGELDLRTNDGRIELTDVRGPSVFAQTRSGSLALSHVAADRLEARTEDGRIAADAVRLIDGALATRDGRVHVGFTADSDATVDLRTDDGRITAPQGNITTSDGEGDRQTRTIRLGSGRGRFEVSSGDGSVSLSQGASV